VDRSEKTVFGTLFFSIFATVTGVGIVVPLLPVYAHALGAGGLAIGMIFGAFSLTRTLFLPLFGQWSDRRGRKPFITIGFLAYGLISTAFMAAGGVGSLILIRGLQGAASAMLMPVIQAYVGDITPKGREGWVMGLFHMSLFIGQHSACAAKRSGGCKPSRQSAAPNPSAPGDCRSHGAEQAHIPACDDCDGG